MQMVVSKPELKPRQCSSWDRALDHVTLLPFSLSQSSRLPTTTSWSLEASCHPVTLSSLLLSHNAPWVLEVSQLSLGLRETRTKLPCEANQATFTELPLPPELPMVKSYEEMELAWVLSFIFHSAHICSWLWGLTRGEGERRHVLFLSNPTIRDTARLRWRTEASGTIVQQIC